LVAMSGVVSHLAWLLGHGRNEKKASTAKLKLYKIDEVDRYQRSNPYITSGYRHRLNALDCVKSALRLHNETVNIWTHLAGFLVFSALLIRDAWLPVTLADWLVLAAVLVCYQACMILSSLFHTFTCHSEHVSQRCLCLDLAGISLAVLASYLSGVYYAFWCNPGWRDFYLLTVAGMFLVAAGAQLHPKFSSEAYFRLRLSLFTGWAAYGLVPTAHWLALNGGLSSDDPVVLSILARILLMYAICAVALIFYLARLPERLLPGWVDIIGHSHQWWHVLIFAALLFWHRTGVSFALLRVYEGCAWQSGASTAAEIVSLWPF